jgi:hypothetical protein
MLRDLHRAADRAARLRPAGAARARAGGGGAVVIGNPMPISGKFGTAPSTAETSLMDCLIFL